MSGICSKWESNSKSCDFSVLGYSSKIFRDDEKAKELEQGKHLIPWIGDTSVTIDRFDVRAYLSDLTQFSAGEELLKVCAEEKETEELCDDERYKALFDIEGDEEVYEEEDQKRRKHLFGTNKYSQVSYNYEEPATSHSSAHEVTDTPFKPDLGFEIPSDLVLPISSNLNKIIEKTAACVSKHGKQMEIFIKARQSNNNKFNFMNFESDLYPYYQFILNKMNIGNVNNGGKTTVNSISHQLSQNSTFPDDIELAPGVHLPTEELCPYNMLVNKIQNIHKAEDSTKRLNKTMKSKNNDVAKNLE